MLTELRIRNFAIIDAVTLPLSGGFNVLSGETGAGKSIIVGALALLLGERASADLVRTGAERASVEGVFSLGDRPELRQWLDGRGIDVEDGFLVLKRELGAAGRSRAWINGVPAAVGALAEAGRLLVNLHGQHDAQLLLEPDVQRAMLDAYAGAVEHAARVGALHEDVAALSREAERLGSSAAEARRRADWLRHVAGEIESANLLPGEDAALEDEARRLEHADELRSLAEGATVELEEGEDALLPRLARLQRTLDTLRRIDPSLARLQELYDGAYYALEELGTALGDYARKVDLDPERLEEVRRRRDLLFRLLRKYGPSLEDAIESGRRARAELELVDTADQDLAALSARRAAALAGLEREAAELTRLRADGARRLAGAVDALLPALGMPDGRCTIRLEPLPAIGASGAEAVDFRVALNPGHEARSLARIASGGELSRVMLALKTILARLDHVPTLVFDEVDAGIGGRIALQVGDALRALAEHHQVLAITHLPQLAARAHRHIVVSKGAREGITSADTRVITGQEREAEVARMLGGDAESEISRAHARELLAAAGAAAGVEGGRVASDPRPRRRARHR